MANPIVENIAKTNADALTKSGQAAETIMKGSDRGSDRKRQRLESSCSGVDQGVSGIGD